MRRMAMALLREATAQPQVGRAVHACLLVYIVAARASRWRRRRAAGAADGQAIAAAPIARLRRNASMLTGPGPCAASVRKPPAIAMFLSR